MSPLPSTLLHRLMQHPSAETPAFLPLHQVTKIDSTDLVVLLLLTTAAVLHPSTVPEVVLLRSATRRTATTREDLLLSMAGALLLPPSTDALLPPSTEDPEVFPLRSATPREDSMDLLPTRPSPRSTTDVVPLLLNSTTTVPVPLLPNSTTTGLILLLLRHSEVLRRSISVRSSKDRDSGREMVGRGGSMEGGMSPGETIWEGGTRGTVRWGGMWGGMGRWAGMIVGMTVR